MSSAEDDMDILVDDVNIEHSYFECAFHQWSICMNNEFVGMFCAPSDLLMCCIPVLGKTGPYIIR